MLDSLIFKFIHMSMHSPDLSKPNFQKFLKELLKYQKITSNKETLSYLKHALECYIPI